MSEVTKGGKKKTHNGSARSDEEILGCHTLFLRLKVNRCPPRGEISNAQHQTLACFFAPLPPFLIFCCFICAHRVVFPRRARSRLEISPLCVSQSR